MGSSKRVGEDLGSRQGSGQAGSCAGIQDRIPDLGVGAVAISSSVVFSPDQHWIAMGSSEGAVWVWEVKTGRLMFTLIGHSAPVTCVRFSPDSRRIAPPPGATAVIRGRAVGGELKVWDATTGAERWNTVIDGIVLHYGSSIQPGWSPDCNGRTCGFTGEDVGFRDGAADESRRQFEVIRERLLIFGSRSALMAVVSLWAVSEHGFWRSEREGRCSSCGGTRARSCCRLQSRWSSSGHKQRKHHPCLGFV